MAEPLTFEELEANILGEEQTALTFEELNNPVQIGSTPTPEPSPTEVSLDTSAPSFDELNVQAASLGSYGNTLPYPVIDDNDPDRDLKWWTNFLNSMYAATIPTFKAAMAELSGDHDKAKFIRQEAAKLYDAERASGYAGGIASSVATTATALGGAALAGPGTAAAGIIFASYLGYHAIMGMGQAKGLLKDYEEDTGEDVNALYETAVTLGGGVIFAVAEKVGAKWLMKSGMLSRTALKEIGQAFLAKDTKLAVSHIMKNVPISMFKGAWVEGAEEGIEQGLGNFMQMLYNPSTRDLESLVEGVPESMVAGAIAGSILGGGITVAQTTSPTGMAKLATDYMNEDEAIRIKKMVVEAHPDWTEDNADLFVALIGARANTLKIPFHEFASKNLLSVESAEAKNIEKKTKDLFNMVGENTSRLSPIQKGRLVLAQGMVDEGKTREDIFKTTGWYQANYDGKWRMQLDSNQMKFTDKFKSMLTESVFGTYKLKDFINYPELFEIYPDIKDASFKFENLPHNVLGRYSPFLHKIALDPTQIQNASNFVTWEENIATILVHEIQHYIQDVEKTNQFGSISDFFGLLEPKQISEANIRELIKNKLTNFLRLESLTLTTEESNAIIEWLPYYYMSALTDNTTEISPGTQSVERHAAVLQAFDSTIQRLTELQGITITQLENITSALFDTHTENIKWVTDFGRSITYITPKYLGKGTDLVRAKYDTKYKRQEGDFLEMEGRDAEIRRSMTPEELREKFPDSGKVYALIYLDADNEITHTYSKKDLEERVNESPDIGAPLLHRKDKVIKGSITPATEKQSVIKAFGAADVETLFHELGHMFRFSLTKAELDTAEKLFKVKDGNWTRGKEEKFADEWMNYLRSGKTKNKSLKNIFDTLGKWLVNLFTNVKDIPEVTISKEMSDFFDSLLTQYESELFTDVHAEQGKRNIISRWAKKMKDGILDNIDIGYKAKRIGMERVGLALKNTMSIRTNYQKEGEDVLAGMFNALTKTGMNTKQARVALNELVFEYEDKRIWWKLSKKQKDNKVEARKIIDTYFKKSLKQYKDRGLLNKGFIQRMTDMLNEQIMVAESKRSSSKKKTKIATLKTQLRRVKDMNYVPIPLGLWAQSQMKYQPHMTKAIISWLNNRARKTFMIADLVKDLKKQGFKISKDDVKMGDIIASYSNRKGKDFANYNLLQAAIKDKQVTIAPVNRDGTVSKKRIKGFQNPPRTMSFLKGYKITPQLGQFISEMTRRIDTIGLPSKLLNIAKMTAFWNPLFLPMYDSIQAAMLGSFNPLRPIRSLKFLRDGWRSIRDNDEVFQVLERSGQNSTPFANHLEGHMDMLDAMATKGKYKYRKVYKHILGNFMKSLTNPKALIKNAFGLKTIYNLSWKTAWMLDQTVRTASSHYLHDVKGMSWEDAAQRAALYHGDYAGVPSSTRRHLNRIFFTPTFKIAMGKLYVNMISDFGNTLHPNPKTGQQAKDNRMSVIRMIAIISAWDMLMLALGYERDEWGRRYVKATETDEGPKESVLTWSGPHNMFLKYLYRAQSAAGPAVDNTVAHFLRSNKWEIHPLYRVLLEIVDNRTPGGETVVNTFDPSIFRKDVPIKEFKQITYLLKNVVTVLRVMGDEFEDPKAREQLRFEMKEAAGSILGRAISSTTRPFTFTYLRDIEVIRASQGVQSLGVYLSRDLNTIIDKVGEIDPDVLDRMIDEYVDRVNEVFLDADLIDYDLDDEPR